MWKVNFAFLQQTKTIITFESQNTFTTNKHSKKMDPLVKPLLKFSDWKKVFGKIFELKLQSRRSIIMWMEWNECSIEKFESQKWLQVDWRENTACASDIDISLTSLRQAR